MILDIPTIRVPRCLYWWVASASCLLMGSTANGVAEVAWGETIHGVVTAQVPANDSYWWAGIVCMIGYGLIEVYKRSVDTRVMKLEMEAMKGSAAHAKAEAQIAREAAVKAAAEMDQFKASLVKAAEPVLPEILGGNTGTTSCHI